MAGLAELLLGASNPFAQWANTHSNFLGSVGAGLGSGQNFAAGVSNAAQLAPQGRALDQQEAEKAKAEAKIVAQENATKAWLAQNYPQYSNLPVDQGFQLALKEMSGGGGTTTTDDIREFTFAKQNGYGGSFMDWMTKDKGSGARPALGTTIYTARDQQGNLVPMQVGQGEFVPTKLPDGMTFDPAGLNEQRSMGTGMGKERASATAALPGLETNVGIATDALARIRSNVQGLQEHFNQVPGLPRDMYVVPGSALGNLQGDLNQAIGQSFMQARQMLKGGGQITDYEGRKAEEAYTRMRRAYDQGDLRAFSDAMDEFESYLNQGLQKMQAFANGTYQPGSPTGDTGGGFKVLSVE